MQEIQIITTEEFEKCLRSIVDIRSRRRITLRIQKLKLGNFGDYKSVGKEIYELRIHFGSGYRAYFAFKQTFLNLDFFTKITRYDDRMFTRTRKRGSATPKFCYYFPS